MKKNRALDGPRDADNLKPGINRREVVRRLMLVGGAGLALPGIAEGNPGAGQSAGNGATPETEPRGSESNWRPVFLDRHQIDTLAVLAERIIPGSSKARVNCFIDLLLSVDTQEPQRAFVASLSAFEAESLRRFSRPFKSLAENQQVQILAASSGGERGYATEGKPQQLTLRDHFENIKSWVSGAYYSSEIGMKELGWTGQVYFSSFPGCPKSGKRP